MKESLIEQTWAAELMPDIYTRPNYTTGRDETGVFVLKNQLYNTNSKNHGRVPNNLYLLPS